MNKIQSGSWSVGEYGFSSKQMQELAKNRFITFIGDSVTRTMYKDFIRVLNSVKVDKNTEDLLTRRDLTSKGEYTILGDDLIEGGKMDGLFNGKNYIEVREFRKSQYLIRFYFVTRVFYSYTDTIFEDFKKLPPDVLVIGSACWDVTRYNDEIKSGPKTLNKYKTNINLLFKSVQEIIPECLSIWCCCMPLGSEVKGGFLPYELEYNQERLRQDIVEANYFSSKIAAHYEIDVIDLHYYFRKYSHGREADGIHWNATVHRNITYMLAHHVASCFNKKINTDKQYAVPIKSSQKPLRAAQTNWDIKSRPDVGYMNQDTVFQENISNSMNSYKMKSSVHQSTRQYRRDPYERPEAHRPRNIDLRDVLTTPSDPYRLDNRLKDPFTANPPDCRFSTNREYHRFNAGLKSSERKTNRDSMRSNFNQPHPATGANAIEGLLPTPLIAQEPGLFGVGPTWRQINFLS